MPFFTEWIGASSFEVILAGPSRHSTTGTVASGTSGSRRFSFILLHERIRRRIRLCQFCTLVDIVTETAIVSFRTMPVGFPLPTISQNPLSTLFCPLILDHGVLLKISISAPKILISNILLNTSFHHSVQSVIIRSGFLLDESPYCTIPNTVLSYSDSRILNLYNPSRMSSDGIFVIDNKIPSHFESNS